MRAVVGQAAPIVIAKALTFTAQKAQQRIVAEFPKAFDSPTRYTLNSTRIETATVDKLSARVAVKDMAAGGGTLPENFLLPGVAGGARREKRFERALRAEGLLLRNERAVLGDLAPRDAAGNYRLGELRTLLRSVRGLQRTGAPGFSAKPGRVRKDLFVGAPGKPGSLPGVYRRVKAAQGRTKLQPLLIFVTKQPTYRKVLDFEGIARATAEREFPATFRRLLAAATR